MRVWCKEEFKIGQQHLEDSGIGWTKRLAWLCPTLDVTLLCEYHGEEVKTAVRASDWVELDGVVLLKRIAEYETSVESLPTPEPGKRLTVLEDATKRNVGRAVVTPFGSRSDTAPGIVTVSGMRTSEVSGVAGVFLAMETTASRRHALPIVPLDELARWSTKQANELLKVCSADLTEQIAPIISSLLGDIGEFKVRDYHGARQSIAEIAQRKDLPDELLIVDPTFSFSGTRKPGAMAYIISTQFHIPLRGLGTRDVWPPLSLSQPDGRAQLAERRPAS